MNNLFIYLFIGIVVDIIYNSIANYIDSKNKLNNFERTVSLLAWPIVIIIFIYQFLKSFNGKP
tara:strand:+ start:470 stop:658 length:189 start_codon:yes stop_codon:yes gene_type:complete